MTGYLERLVSSAIDQSSGVHPALGPIFAAPGDRAGDGSSLAEEDGSSASALPKATPSMEGAKPSSTAARVDKTGSDVAPVAYLDHEPGEEIAVPPLARPARHAARGSAQDPAPGRRTPLADEGETSRTSPEYAPLLPEVSAASPSFQSESAPARSLRPMTAAHADSGDRSLRASPAKSGPDEIQITIGRIEVTAVPETRARPAAKPTRKPLSLDEYLKRADAGRR
jgi:hypothetical protein